MVLVAGFSCWLMFSTFLSLHLARLLANLDNSLKVKVVFTRNSLAIHHEKRTILEIVAKGQVVSV